MDDASPPKWHLAHVTWFFETFILREWVETYQPFHPQFEYLFNSYYNGVGTPYPRPQRGFLSRPTVAEVFAYRQAVDNAMLALLEARPQSRELLARVTLGLHHEQQHQELLLTDIKYNFGHNPLYPSLGGLPPSGQAAGELTFTEFAGGVVPVGVDATAEAFKFDNECPRHEVLLQPYKLANRLISNAEYRAFVEDSGYQRADLWLAEGWAIVQAQGWSHPLYWRKVDEVWHEYRLDGFAPLNPHLPVTHCSAHEAYAFAQWKGMRLPTEFEWEHAAGHWQPNPDTGFVEAQRYHPGGFSGDHPMQQLYGCAWQWTSSSYAPYPGYRPLPGTLGEYNGKFMSSQLVLRGGSCATPRSHIRPTYRNFFYPPDRWQFTGIRLAEDCD